MYNFYKKLKIILRKIHTFLFKIKNSDKLLFIKAFFLTGLMRFKILKKPFNEVKSQLGEYNKESCEDVSHEDYKFASKIRWIVTTVSKYTPWESLCLVQAMTVQYLLNKNDIDTTIYLGVNKDGNDMNAHAWIRCGRMFVTGGNGNGYAVVAKFCKLANTR